MDRKTPKADKFLKDLRLIPKMIETLERDGNLLSKSLIKSPQWHENAIKGGIRKTQEDRNVEAIDRLKYYSKQIEKLKSKRDQAVSLIIDHTDLQVGHVLITTYLVCDNNDMAMETLEIRHRNKFFKLLRQGKESLEEVL